MNEDGAGGGESQSGGRDAISAVAADSGRAFKDFVDLPYRIQGDNPLWAPPLRMHQKETLNRSKNPFFEHAEMQLFVAYRAGQPVGRIAAISDNVHNRTHNETTTHFGFFECFNDLEAAAALFAAVETAARAWGHNMVRGPFDPSVNEEIGTQIDAFDTPNYIMIKGNPPHYGGLIEAQGYAKCMDLFCYRATDKDISQRLLTGAEAMRRRVSKTIKLRSPTKKSIACDAEKIWRVYNSAWEENWYWVHASREEFMALVNNLIEIADFDLIFLAENERDELVGFIVAVPNINAALAKLRDGRLLPFGLPKLMWLTRPGAIRSLRVLVMGVLKDYRFRGIDAAMYYELFLAAKKKGYVEGEMSQILESNAPMNRALEIIGAKRYKTHRMYEKAL